MARGVPLLTVARMLGHTQPTMTLRYAHVGDREVEAAAERVGAMIAAVIEGKRPLIYGAGCSMNGLTRLERERSLTPRLAPCQPEISNHYCVPLCRVAR